MLKTAVIGVGNAGGNVAKLVHEKASFPAIALNTSNQDLTALVIQSLYFFSVMARVSERIEMEVKKN